jgi:hypothetical protein
MIDAADARVRREQLVGELSDRYVHARSIGLSAARAKAKCGAYSRDLGRRAVFLRILVCRVFAIWEREDVFRFNSQ